MVSSPFSRAWVFADLRGRKHPLPTPLFLGIGIFASKCIWRYDPTKTTLKISLMHLAHSCEVSDQRRFDNRREHGNPIFVAFPFAHDNLIGGKIEILDP